MDISLKIKLLRAERKVSQRQLAELAGVDNNTIARIESKNIYSSPRVETLFKIAKALNVDVKELLDCER